MSFSFTSLIRLMVLTAVVSTMMAVGLSKLAPPPPASKSRTSPRFSHVNEFFLDVSDRTPRWLDSETGRIVPCPPAGGDILEAASCSPWVDENDRRQIVGRWSSRMQDGVMPSGSDFGIARYSFPDGAMLDQVSTETVPVSSPVWFPGTRARVLFAAGDGDLYHFAFEPDNASAPTDPGLRPDLSPRLVTWRCPKPGVGNVFLADPTWPDDPRLGGCLLVTLREQQWTPSGTRVYSPTNLWWLKLNTDGTEVLDAGRFLIPEDGEGSRTNRDLRSPTVGHLPDGRLVVAYLRQLKGDTSWELRLAPIEFESDHRNPRARESRSLSLAPKCLPAHPSFSADSSRINAIAVPEVDSSRVIRLSLDNLFPKGT